MDTTFIKKKIPKSQRKEIKELIKSTQSALQYDKLQYKNQVQMFIKDLITKYNDEIILELLICDISILFYDWRNKNNMMNCIDTTNLGVIIYNLKINGITKGQRKSSGNTKIFNIKQIKDHFNAGATQEPQ